MPPKIAKPEIQDILWGEDKNPTFHGMPSTQQLVPSSSPHRHHPHPSVHLGLLGLQTPLFGDDPVQNGQLMIVDDSIEP